MAHHVLVVEDDKDICDLMVLHLKRENLKVSYTHSGEQALLLIRETSPRFDLLVLDWMLPTLSGLDLLKQVQPSIATLMVTARSSSTDIILGLESGADDYITKPFEIPVFIARIRSLLRRATQTKPSQLTTTSLINYGPLEINLDAHEARIGNEKLILTLSEFKLLLALAQNQGKVLSRDALIRLVQGEGIVVTERAIDTHIFGLRKKLGTVSDWIETIRGVGYRVKEIPSKEMP